MTESGNTVKWESFHDGSLDGIVLGDDRDCSLLLRTVDNKRYTLFIRGVRLMRADEFKEGNIILDATEYAADSAPFEAIGKLVYVLNGSEDHPDITRERERMIRSEERVIQISPSYGCALVASYLRAELTAGWCLCGGEQKEDR